MVSNAIINAYVRRINRGLITIDDVPDVIKTEVVEILIKKEKQNENI